MATLEQKLVSNTVYLFLNWASLFFLSFLFWIVSAKLLTPIHYGIVATSLALISILGVLATFGMGTAVSKLLPEFITKKRTKLITKLIKSSLKMLLVFTSILVLVLTVFSPQLSTLLKLSEEVIWLSILGILFLSLQNFSSGVLVGFQQMRKLFLTTLAGQIIKLVVTVALILLGFFYFGPIVGVLTCFLFTFLLRFRLEWVRGPSQENLNKILFTYSIPALAAGMVWNVFYYSNYLILSFVKYLELTAFFAVGMALASIIAIIPTILGNALFPIISGLCAEKRGKMKQKYLLTHTLRYALFLTLPLAVFLILFGKQAILLFARPEYLEAVKILPILSLGAVVLGFGLFFLHTLYALRQPKVYTLLSLFSVSVFFFLSILLTYLFSIYGPAVAYLAASLFLVSISFKYITRILTLRFPVNGLSKIIFSTSLVFCLFYSLFWILPAGPWIKILLSFFALILYLIILLPLKFYTLEDVKLFRFLGSITPKPLNRVLIRISNFLQKHIS